MNTDTSPGSTRTGLQEVLQMAIPVILGTLSFTIMQFVDQVMVAQLGKASLAAIGSAGLWSFTMASFFMGIAQCVSTFASQSFGKGRLSQCAQYCWQGIYLSLFTGVFALILWPLTPSLFGSMHHSAEVTRLETIYFRIRLFGYLFIAWQISLASFFQSVNQPRIPMWIAGIANVINIALDYVLIFGKLGFPQWGIGGAAIATVFSLALQTILLQAIFMSAPLNKVFQTRHTYRFDLEKFRELFHIGWPSGITLLADVLNWAVFTSLIVGYFGDDTQLAANNTAMAFLHLCFMPCVGLSQAVTPIVGQWVGKKCIQTAKARTYTAIRLAIPYMVFMGLIFAVFGAPLIRIVFSRDPQVIRLGHQLLIMAAIFQGFDAVNIVLIGALRGTGDTRYMLKIFLFFGYGFFLPIAALLAWLFPVAAIGAWTGAVLYIIGLSFILLHRFHGERWRHIRIFRKEPAES